MTRIDIAIEQFSVADAEAKRLRAAETAARAALMAAEKAHREQSPQWSAAFSELRSAIEEAAAANADKRAKPQ